MGKHYMMTFREFVAMREGLLAHPEAEARATPQIAGEDDRLFIRSQIGIRIAPRNLMKIPGTPLWLWLRRHPKCIRETP